MLRRLLGRDCEFRRKNHAIALRFAIVTVIIGYEITFAAGSPPKPDHSPASPSELPFMRQVLPRILAAFACACLLTRSARASAVQLDPPDLAPAVSATSLLQIDVIAGISGAPNGFAIQWMTKAQFDALGGWPADATSPAIQSAIYPGK